MIVLTIGLSCILIKIQRMFSGLSFPKWKMELMILPSGLLQIYDNTYGVPSMAWHTVNSRYAKGDFSVSPVAGKVLSYRSSSHHQMLVFFPLIS